MATLRKEEGVVASKQKVVAGRHTTVTYRYLPLPTVTKRKVVDGLKSRLDT